MRKFLAFILLAVPFISSAQTGPQMQISNLQTAEVSYHAGQEITGSFVMNNIGDENIPDVQYYVAVGGYGGQGGVLANETAVSDISEPLYLPAAARLEIPFSITPDKLPDGEVGLHVFATQKNGMVLGWKKIPLTYEGDVAGAVTPVIGGYFYVEGQKYPLESNVTFERDETASFFVLLPEGLSDGSRDVRVTLYDKNVGQDTVYDETITVEFVDGEGVVMLPDTLKPKTYAGQVSLADGSSVLSLIYTVAGPQAEVLSVDSDLLSLKADQNFIVSLSYADTPLNARNPEATEYPEGLSMRLKILNEDGELVAQHEQALETTQKPDLLVVDENSTEEEQERAAERLAVMFENEHTVEIPLVSQTRADYLTFEVELYDTKTGDTYDTYKTTFPSEDGKSPLRAVMLATFAAILILLILAFKSAKHKIPMVCLAFAVTSLAAGYAFVNRAEAYKIIEQKGWLNSHTVVVTQPDSSRSAGYDQGEAIPLEVSVTGKAWPSNGFLNHKIWYPYYTRDWAGYKTAKEALNHVSNKGNRTDPSKYVLSTSFDTDNRSTYFNKSFTAMYMYAANGSSGLSPRLAPGKHYIPLATQYCTASHGCAKPTYVVFEMCVNGAGVCPGETGADACPYINGVSDPAVQTEVPENYSKEGSNCVNTCVSNVGQPCGCGNEGTIQCDGSCSAPLSCTGLGVSCSATPNHILAPRDVTFTASARNVDGDATYVWKTPGGSTIGTGLSYTMNNVDETTTLRVEVEDESDAAETSCTVTFGTEPVCPEGETCEPPVTDTTPTATFDFDPRIVRTGQSCRLVMEASQVSACELRRVGSSAPYLSLDPTTGGAHIRITPADDEMVTTGTYRMWCKGIDLGDTFQPLGNSRQCISLPNISEN